MIKVKQSALQFCFLSILLFSFCAEGTSQSYGTALGLRLGNSNSYRTVGLTLEQRLAKHFTVEGIYQTDFRYNNTFHFLAKGHHNIITKRLNMYVGAGPSFGSEISTITAENSNNVITYFGNTVGVDLVAGLELTLLGYNFSLDYKPNFNLEGREQWFLGQVGFSARMVLISGAAQNKRWREKERDKRQETRQERRQDFWDRTFKK